MIAWMMVFGGLPVYGGVLAMMMVGFLLPLFAGDYITSAFAWINSTAHHMPYHFTTMPDWLFDFFVSVDLPTEVTNSFVVFFLFAYMAFEILTFALIMLSMAKKGRRIPNIKQDF